MYKVVLIRHGESQLNLENRFAGWSEEGNDLSDRGWQQAIDAGEVLKKEGYVFDIAFTSVLKRSIHTLWKIQDILSLQWIPTIHSWRLNERHYGALQRQNRIEAMEEFGDEQVAIWRRSFATPPPPVSLDDPRHPIHDPRYAEIPSAELPTSEALVDTMKRVLPFWVDEIVPAIKEGKRVIVAAHGNSLRSLVMHLDQMSEDEITKLNIPTGIPLVYELDDDLKPIKHYYLGDPKAIQAAIDVVVNQTKKS